MKKRTTKWPSKRPCTCSSARRFLALVPGALLCAVAGVVRLTPLFWPAFARTLRPLAANAANPSHPKRLLWTPVPFLMAASALGVRLS